MNFCSRCGGRVRLEVPEKDDRERYICDHCRCIHYDNPKIVTGCFITHKNRILLCRRSIPPEAGLWTLPAGFMENGESSEQAAEREAWEEAHAGVRIEGLYFLIDFPQFSQVYLIYRGVLRGFNTHRTGHESDSVDLFSEEKIPWEELAFDPVVKMVIEYYLNDRKTSEYPMRNLTINDLNLWGEDP